MDFNWLLGPAIVLGVWAIATIVLMGLGLGVGRLLRLRSTSLLDAFWLGYCVTILILQMWHFWLPVGIPAMGTLVCAGVAGFVWSARSGQLPENISRAFSHPTSLLLLCVATIWVANRATGPVENNDSASYHITGVRWNADYAIVPGLGNLQGRLAFNNSSLLFVAMFEAGPLRGRSSHFANSLLLAALFWQVILRSRGLFGRDTPPIDRAIAIYNAVLLIPAVAVAVSKELASPATDLPPLILALYAASRLFDILLRSSARAGESSVGNDPFGVLTTAVAFTTAVCLKLSAIVFAPFAWAALVGAALISRKTLPGPVVRRTMVAAIGISCILIMSWFGRGVILSGYPLFPSTVLSLPVDWRMPLARLEHEAQIIDSWARYDRAEFIQSSLQKVPWVRTLVKPRGEVAVGMPPVLSPDGSDASDPPVPARHDPWVALWFVAAVLSTPTEIAVPLVVAAAAWGATLLRRRRTGARLAAPVVVALLVTVGAVLWFIIAPEPRFGAFLFWTLACCGVAALVLTIQEPSSAIRLARAVVLLCALAALVPIAHRMIRIRVQTQSSPLKVIPFYYPGPDHGLHPLPTAEFGEFQTDWGMTILYPKQSPDMWDGPLPCSPQVSRFLRLRREGNLGGGFRIDVPVERRITEPSRQLTTESFGESREPATVGQR